jgi:hypothetical protein
MEVVSFKIFRNIEYCQSHKAPTPIFIINSKVNMTPLVFLTFKQQDFSSPMNNELQGYIF